MAITVQEITIAAPDVICVEIHDSPIVRGDYVFPAPALGGGIDAGAGTVEILGITAGGTSGWVRIQCADASFAQNNGWMKVYGVTGTVEANGTWGWSYIDATHFELWGVRHLHAWTGGGRFFVATNNSTVTRHNPITDQDAVCQIIGFGKGWRFMDQEGSPLLDRTAIDDHASYGAIGTRTVTKVTRISVPYEQGWNFEYGADWGVSGFKHFCFLHLNGDVESGAHVIDFPAATGIADANFTYSDVATRATAIRANQVGHRKRSRKLAHLAMWIPGYGSSHGAVDFSAFTEFEVIDDADQTVFTGVIEPLLNATEVEYNLRDGAAGSRHFYPSTTAGTISITNITNANPGVVTHAAGGGFTPQNGDRLWLFAIGGMSQINAAQVIVSNYNAGARTFEIGNGSVDGNGSSVVNTSGFSAFTTGDYMAPYENLAYKTLEGNRAFTNTYLLDYSRFITGIEGASYRLRVAGLGVSDPFVISEDVFYDIAYTHAKGIVTQISGIEQDGRFGYMRPTAFKDGVNDSQFYVSTCPVHYTSEWPISAVQIQSGALGVDPWTTNVRATGWGGTYFDAGDWDESIWFHDTVYYYLLELAEWATDAAKVKMAAWDIPKCTDYLDAGTYAGTDDLPAPFHLALLALDTYRRTQSPAGWVFGGQGHISGQDGGGIEGCDTFTNRSYVYACDEVAAYPYIALAAKVAVVCYKYGLNTLGNLWRDSAIACWNWVEPIFADTGTGGPRDAYYLTYCGVVSKGGVTAQQYADMNTLIRNSYIVGQRMREWAGISLYRATGNIAYDLITQLGVAYMDVQGEAGMAANEYMHAGINETIAQSYRDKSANYFWLSWDNSFGNSMVYPTGRYNNYWHGFSGGSISIFKDYGDRRGIDQIEMGIDYAMGGNLEGFCVTTGLGVRNPGILHRDREARNVGKPVGYTPYVWGIPTHPFGFFNLSGEGGAVWNKGFTWSYPRTSRKYMVEPWSNALPVMRGHIENTYLVWWDEFTIQHTLSPCFHTAIGANYYCDQPTRKAKLKWGGAGKPDRPVITWDSAANDLTPTFGFTLDAAAAGDEVEIYVKAGYKSLINPERYVVQALTSGDVSGNNFTPGFAALPTGLHYAKLRHRRPDGLWSIWSPVVSKTLTP